jgi:hypothetical protein
MKVAWTARARTRLAEIHDYIAQDSEPARSPWSSEFSIVQTRLCSRPAAERGYRLSSTTKFGKSLKGRIGLFTEFLSLASKY